MKKIISLVLVIMMVLSVVGCGNEEAKPSQPAQPTQAEKPANSPEVKAVEGLKEPIAEQPALLTSVGQSADVEMVKTMLTKVEVKFTCNSMATSADIKDNKTLILAVGGSSKGLGAAGINADEELARVTELINAADEKGLVIVVVHIGGEARRGELSDKFITPSFEKADYAIIVSEGDKDGLMTSLASQNGIPMDSVKTMADVMTPLKNAFK